MQSSEREHSVGLWASVAIVAGSMLGIGIFLAPAQVASATDHPTSFLAVWCLGGLSALAGALSIAELGAMVPRAGGDYPYLRMAYGDGVAFAAGWLQLVAIFPGSLATMAYGTASFQLPVLLGDAFAFPSELGLPIDPPAFWSILILVALTAINHVGVALSGRAQVALTVVPVAVLALTSVFVLLRRGTGTAWTEAGPWSPPAIETFAAGFSLAYFAFSGWYAALFIGGEIRNPSKTLPRALIGGTAIVTLLYALLLLGFLSVFTMPELAATGEVGSAAAATLFGRAGELVALAAIVIALLGSINGTVLTGSRIAFSMAARGHFWRRAGTLHPRFRTPTLALWAQTGIAILLIFTQSFELLLDYTVAAMWITGSLTVFAVIMLRYKMPDAPRPYRTVLYPFTPLFFVATSAVAFAVLTKRAFASGDTKDLTVPLTLAWFGAALVVERVWVRRRARR